LPRILQLSDCHVSADPSVTYRGIDARTHLAAMLPAISDWAPDLLLLTGDLAEDEAEPTYAWLAAELGTLKIPMLALPGNHDQAELLGRHFDAPPPRGLLAHDLDGWRLVLLDSAVPGEVPGRLREEQIDSLAEQLQNAPGPALVALHHQPLPVGSPWIDRYPLLDPGPLWSVLLRHRARAVVWGHIHQPFAAELEGVRALGCPSTASNSLPGQEKFALDGRGPAARWLELDATGWIGTGLLRPGEGPSLPAAAPARE
jgi:Icc protein